MNHLERIDTQIAIDCLRRSLAMMALAKISNWPREQLFKKEKASVSVNGVMQLVEEEVAKLTIDFDKVNAKRLPREIADKLRERVARGDVTCIVKQPEPFTWLTFKLEDGNEVRTIYGIWVGRVASWRGNIDPAALPHLGAMTPEEAEAKGIPVPKF